MKMIRNIKALEWTTKGYSREPRVPAAVTNLPEADGKAQTGSFVLNQRFFAVFHADVVK